MTSSRYDNVKAQDYPNILITAGLHDPRVAYWEPAKWASKLRTVKTDNNEVRTTLTFHTSPRIFAAAAASCVTWFVGCGQNGP